MRGYYIICIVIISTIFSCKTDNTEPILVESIQGKWLIEEAFRNNRKTDLLRNGYFEITDSTFSTNINPQGIKTSRYTYIDNKITIREEEEEHTVYNVEYATEDTLRMNTSFGHFDFKFMTVKEKDDK